MVNHSSLNISSARVLTSAWVALILFASVSFADPVVYTDDTLPAANISIGADGVEFQLSAAKTYAYTMSGSGAFYKTGDGTLTLNKNGSTFTGDVHLDGGKISVSAKCTGTNSTLGKVQAGRTIYISNGTELVFANQDILTNAHNDNPVAYLVDGGKISNSGAYYNFLQTVTLKNGANIHAANGNTTWEAYKFQNINVVSNSDGSAATAPTITGANNDHAVISFGGKSDDVATKPSTIYVENITNNANSDFVISAKIVNATTVNTGVKTAGEIYKTGTGTLELKNVNSSYSGNLTIKEGTLKVTAGSNADNRTASALGASNVAGRTVTINKGAVLELAAQDVMCDTHSNTKLTFVVDGGKITNSGANFNFLQNVTLKDGANIYAANGNTSWEAYKIQNLRVERSGDAAAAAVSLTAASGDHNVFTFGAISSTITTTPVSIYVEDITSANGASDTATDLLISAKIVDANTDGKTKKPAPMVKSGAGTLELKNAGNTYSGNLTIDEGTVKVTAGSASNNRTASALGAGNVAGRLVTVNESAVLDLTVDNVIVNAHTDTKLAIVVDGGQIINSGYNYLQNLTLKDGAQVYAANGAEVWKSYKFHNLNIVRKSADAADSPVVISSDLSKPYATIAFGAKSDTIKVGDNNSISTVTVEEITSDDPYVNDNVSDLVISAIIADPLHTTSGALTNATQIVKAGAGTMEITAANTITGKTTISEGTLKLSGNGTLGSGEVINNSTLEFAHESDQTFNNVISGTGDVIKTGSGTLIISGNNTYTGETKVLDGTLNLTKTGSDSASPKGKASLAAGVTVTVEGENSVLKGHGTIFGYGAGSIGRLNLYDGGTLENDSTNGHVTISAPVYMDSGVISSTGNGDNYGNFIIDGGIHVIGGEDNVIDAVKFQIRNDQSYGNTNNEQGGTFDIVSGAKLSINSNISNYNSADMTPPVIKKGEGELVLSGASTYTKGTQIEAGVLTVANNAALGATTGTVTFTGNSTLKAGADNLALTNPMTVNSGVTGTVDTDGKSLSLGGVISGEGNVTKTGAGTLTLTGANTYSGKTTISDGALKLTGSSMGTGDIEINGALDFASGSNLTYSGVISGTGAALKTGTGILELSGANSYTGETTVSGGTLKLTGNAVAANGPITVESGTLEFNVTSDKKLVLSATNAISTSETGQIVKTGEGTLRFDADENSFDAKNLVLAEGRLDVKGTMNGNITVNKGVFSPGNSVGTTSVKGNVVITDAGKALFEFSPYDDGDYDKLFILNGEDTDFTFTAGESMVQLFFENDDASLWAAALEGDSGYKLVSGADFTSIDISSWLGTNTDLFSLEGRSDGLYLIGLGADPGPGPDPGSGVPEPSTWALLVLGAAGLLYWRKRK